MQQIDDPPYLSVGTEVSAKYKGAFCEAKVRKVVRNIKCKVAYKQGLGTGTISDDQIKAYNHNVLRVGAVVEVKHPDRRDMVEATITKIQDCSQYTVVFDDGDITTLRRSALCLKSGRHFNESETLDQLPLTHPEHFGNPVMGGRRGRSCRSRQMQDDSSDEDDEPESKQIHSEKEEHIGKVVCVESTDTKKKGPKENWFPALVVSPTTQETVRIRVKDEYLVRSFKDGRYYTVPKKEANEFTREMSHKQEGPAISAALQYLDNDVLPPHWDRDALFGIGATSSDTDQDFDSDSSDDEPREEKDHFVAQLYKYMDDRGTPLNKGPSIANRDVDLYRLFSAVHKLGGYNRVTTQNQWKSIAMRLGFTTATNSITNLVKQAYKKFLQPFEEFNRKLGCTMVAHPRANRIKGRSLVRANSVASPKPSDQKEGIKSSSSATAAEESENNSESGTEMTKTSKRKLSTGSIGKVKSLIDKFEESRTIEKPIVKEEPIVSDIPMTPTTSRAAKIKEEPVTPIAIVKKEKIIVEKVKEVKEERPIDLLKEKEKEKDKLKNEALKNLDKRGRKKKDSDVEKVEKVEVKKEDINDPFPIEIGDKLKVYYHEQKVTYEAKVIEISEAQGTTVYLVHYTGWNTRYDEWVPKERIAENLTNNKSKKGKNQLKDKSSGNNNSTGPSTTPTTSASKLSIKRARGGSRGDSQPPRSTTPSSIASNSSRTKSPATTAQRRTTRGQPNTFRRTSNNTDISSLQTDTDSDSDEPVKKPPNRRSNMPSTPSSTSNQNQPHAMSIGSSRSGSSQDEDNYSNMTGVAKGRDFDLNQIRSELKGFKEIKSPSPDTERIPSLSSKPESDIKTECDDDKPLIKLQPGGNIKKFTAVSTSGGDTSKTSSDLSSETDSMADDDSQSSVDKASVKIRKPTPMDVPIKAEKPEKKIPEPIPTKLVVKEEKVVVEEEKKEIKVEVKPIVPKPEKSTPTKTDKKNLISEKGKLLIGKAATPNIVPSAEKLVDPKLPEVVVVASTSTVPDIYEFKEPEPFEFETTGTPSKKSVPSPVEPPPSTEKRGKPVKAKLTDEFEGKSTVITEPPVVTKPTAASKRKKVSPNKDQEVKAPKQPKKEEPPVVKPPITVPQPISPVVIQAEPTPSVSIPLTTPISIITSNHPSQTLYRCPADSTFDVLRKSPSFNINKSGAMVVENAGIFVEEKALQFSPQIQPETMTMPSILKHEGLVFEPKMKFEDVIAKDAVKSSIEKLKEEVSIPSSLESVKKLMMGGSNFVDLKPSKFEKPSIADKVLKALNQQQIASTNPTTSSTITSVTVSSIQPPPLSVVSVMQSSPPIIIAKPQTITIPIQQTTTSSLLEPIHHIPIILPAPIKIIHELPPPSIINKKDFEPLTTAKKSIISSPEIFESIIHKKNDLSETILKLESSIKKSVEPVQLLQPLHEPNLDRFNDDSSDSTDSEQRLVIEDESQSSDIQPPSKIETTPAKIEPISREDLNPFSSFSSFKIQEGLLGLNRPPLDKQQLNAVEFLTTGMIDRENERLMQLAKENRGGIVIAPTIITSPITESILLGPAMHKKDESPLATEQSTQNESISMLLCEETIPGSPAPQCGNTTMNPDQPKKIYEPPYISQSQVPHNTSSDIKPVPMDIESDLSSVKPSIIEKMTGIVRTGVSSQTAGAISGVNVGAVSGPVAVPLNTGIVGGGTSSSSPRDSISPDDSKSESEDVKTKRENEQENVSPKKRRRPRKSSECDGSSKRKKTGPTSRKPQNATAGSDSDEHSDTVSRNPRRSPKPCQYNFLVQMDNTLSSQQRINVLKKKIQELRKTYNMIKAELASIDRRRKKLRRREREKNKLAKSTNG